MLVPEVGMDRGCFTGRTPTEVEPPAELSDRVLCIWSLEAGPSALLPVIPDGCLDLILCRKGLQSSLILAGLDLEAWTAPVEPNLAYLGVRFRPGVLPDPLGFSAEALAGNRVDVGCEASVGQQRWIRSILTSDQALPIMLEGLATTLRPASSGTLEALHQATRGETGSRTRRTFQRTLTRATGLPPSAWFASARARTAALTLLETGLPLTEVALEAGYADQAHLTREIRRRLGLTPARMRRQRELYLSILRASSAF